jgi:hypothetical protein
VIFATANASTDDVIDTGGLMLTCKAPTATLQVYCHNEKLETETSGWLVTYEILEVVTTRIKVIYN